MSDDLKILIDELKKKVKDRKDMVEPMVLEKMDLKKQKKEFFFFLESLNSEMAKSNTNEVYIQNMLDDFEKMGMPDIRFVIEKSYDKYSKMAELVKKYDDNFNDEEINKYTYRADVLNKVYSFMLTNHMGEYVEQSEE